VPSDAQLDQQAVQQLELSTQADLVGQRVRRQPALGALGV
jgi:hypothetical protein